MKKLTILLSMVLLISPLLACSQNEPAKPVAKAEAKAEKPVDIPSPTPAAAEAVPAGTSGKVIETMNAAGYTYVYVDNGTEKIWAAAPEFEVKVGDDVMVPEGMAMHNYHSQTLNRDFDVVYFVESVLNASNPTMGHSSAMGAAMGGGNSDMKIPAGHPAINGSKAPEEVDLTAIKKADGGMTIAEIYAAKGDLSGKQVTLRGKVVKFSPQIMGTNWMHLQDGSGDLNTGNHDLTVTSSVAVKIGDTVVVTGPLTVDKDFGYGYKYDIIMENADVTVE